MTARKRQEWQDDAERQSYVLDDSPNVGLSHLQQVLPRETLSTLRALRSLGIGNICWSLINPDETHADLATLDHQINDIDLKIQDQT